MFADKMMNRDGDVVRRCRKRRQADGKDMETVEEIFAKLFVGNVLLQIAVGGGDLQK
jgi:hypothetical protein